MTIEEKLKDFILKKYKSIRAFTQEIDMSYSTMDSILRRGIGNSSVTNIIKICKELDISADELADGNIVRLEKSDQKEKPIELDDVFLKFKEYLSENPNITIDGEKINENTMKSINDVLSFSVDYIKKLPK